MTLRSTRAFDRISPIGGKAAADADQSRRAAICAPVRSGKRVRNRRKDHLPSGPSAQGARRRAAGEGLRATTHDASASHRTALRMHAVAAAHNVEMTDLPESHRDLLDAQFATLATVGRDGIPQLTEVWFLYEDGELKLSLNTSRLKTRNLRRRPECSLFVLDVANPYRYIDVRGRARLEPDDDYQFARKVGAKYGGADLSDHDAPGDSRVIVTIEPSNIFAVNMGG